MFVSNSTFQFYLSNAKNYFLRNFHTFIIYITIFVTLSKSNDDLKLLTSKLIKKITYLAGFNYVFLNFPLILQLIYVFYTVK